MAARSRFAARLTAAALVFAPAAGAYAQQAVFPGGEASAPSPLAAWVTGRTQEWRTGVVEGGGGPLSMYDGSRAQAEAARAAEYLAALRDRFDPDALDVDDLILFRSFELGAEGAIAAAEFADQAYIFGPQGGPHQTVALQITSAPFVGPLPPGVTVIGMPEEPPSPQVTAERYVSSIAGGADLLNGAIDVFEARAAAGALPPRRVFPDLIAEARETISGAPFEDGPPSDLLQAVSRNLAAMDIAEDTKAALLNRAVSLMTSDVGPAYRRLVASLERWAPEAPEADGLAGLPQGARYYDYLVGMHTGSDLTAAQASAMGERELARIHDEMRAAMAELGFEGGLEAFFDHLRTDDRFYYPNTDAGRAEYLAETRRVLDAMEARLDEVVSDPPDAPLDVIRYPAEQEADAVSAMYMPAGAVFMGQSDAPARTANYVVNLADMRAAPRYLLQALAHHEGLPGHHLQMSLRRSQRARPMAPLPFGPRGASAHVEGWGMYAERLPLEMGLYTDPYANIGRLGMEAWRAARLVVDSGLHAQGWTRAEAEAFLLANTPLTAPQARIEVERYLNAPGQATVYMTGFIRVLELRERARQALGEDFVLTEFHEQILGHGQLPLSVLEEVVGRWIEDRQAG